VRQSSRRVLLIAAFLASLIGLATARPDSAQPSNQPERPKFILLVIDQVTWGDFLEADAPTLHQIIEKGALGLMVVRTAGSPERGGYLTIGAGTRLRAKEEAEGLRIEPEGCAFDTNEFPWLKEMHRWLTDKNPGSAAVLNLAIASILEDNADLDYPATPGLLGETLRSHGIRVACLGNADLPGRPYRPIAALAMDSKGQVPLGKVDTSLIRWDTQDFTHTSNEALLKAFDEVSEQADFIAIDFGDTTRLARNSQLLTEEAARLHYMEAVKRAGNFLEGLLTRRQGKKWRLMIITPHLRLDRESPGCRFTPVILFGSDVPAGWLTSASTRSRAIVANTDVAPTVLDFFRLPVPAEMVGRPIQVTSAEARPYAHLEWLDKEISRREAVDGQRYLLTRPAMIAIIVILSACAIAVLLERRVSSKLKVWLRCLSLAILSWPVMMLLLGIALPAQIPVSWAIVLLGSVILTFAAVKLSSSATPPFTLLSAVTLLLLALAVLWPDQPLLRYSPLSYSPADGARYYGVGNEFGGALLGAFLFAFPGLWQQPSKLARWLRWPLMGALVFLFGSGQLGANFGMALAAISAFWVVGMMILPPRSIWRRLWAFALAAVVVAMIAGDLLQSAAPSHIGLAAQQLQQPAKAQILGLIARKLEMNWRLLQNSMWTYVLAAALAAIIIIPLKLDRRFTALLQAYPGARTALYASLAGAAAALVFNDSGVIAAALCLIYPAVASAYLALHGASKEPLLDSSGRS